MTMMTMMATSKTNMNAAASFASVSSAHVLEDCDESAELYV